jgi:FG-GAP repeat protein/VCBS repeat protein
VPGADPDGRIDAGSVMLFTGRGGALLRRYDGPVEGEQFGTAIAVGPDLDGDGTPDLLVGAPEASPDGRSAAGRAYIVSGATGEISRTFDGPQAGDEIGLVVAFVGDLDGDGLADIAAGSPNANVQNVGAAGKITVLSSADGHRIFALRGDTPGDAVGTSVAATGDLNGDGIPDLVVGSPGVTVGNLVHAGRVGVLSGANGRIIRRFTGQESEARLGAAVAGGQDFDRDGVNDVVASAPTADPMGHVGGGSVFVFSGDSGALVLRVDGDEDGLALGASLEAVPDIDGDGWPDLVLGTPGAAGGAGGARIVSGRDGSTLMQVVGTTPGAALGSAVADAGDVNGDGKRDLLLGAPHWGGSLDAGRAELWMQDATAMQLVGTPTLGQPVQFDLSGDPGKTYLLFLSLYGGPCSRTLLLRYPIGPGNATALDVRLDHRELTVRGNGLVGELDSSGAAHVTWTVPNLGSLLRHDIQAQFVTSPGAQTPLDKTSNAVTLHVQAP